MKMKVIIADPATLDAAGVRTMRQAAVFLHVGRCGLLGATIPGMTAVLRYPSATVSQTITLLQDAGLVTDYTRKTGKGRARLYVATVKGWGVLTTPPDFTMFRDAGGVAV